MSGSTPDTPADPSTEDAENGSPLPEAKEVSAKHRLKYFAYRIIILISLVFPLPFLYWLAMRLADLNWLVDRRGREAVEANLRQILPDASDKRIRFEARWVFRNFGKYLAEFFRFRKFDHAWLERHVAIRGKEHVDAALAQGNGVILLSAHLSNWELGAAGLARLGGYPINVVSEAHNYAKANELFIREREHMGIHVVPASKASREGLRRLRQGEILCILGDRDPTTQGVIIDFCGRPCRFPQGPARFAIATGAPIVPGFVLRRTNNSFTIAFGPPIPVPDPEDSKADRVVAMTQSFARVIEETIRWHPEEWTVFYRVWEEEWVQ